MKSTRISEGTRKTPRKILKSSQDYLYLFIESFTRALKFFWVVVQFQPNKKRIKRFICGSPSIFAELLRAKDVKLL